MSEWNYHEFGTRRPFSELNSTPNRSDWNRPSDCSEEQPFSKAVISRINKLLNPRLIDTSDMDLEILRMDPNHPLHSMKSFQEMQLPPLLLKGINSMGFYKPSKIQERALPSLISTNPPNMIAQSQSGTGKTATFLMAMLSRVDAEHRYCQCLCMVPTLELAKQLTEVGRQMARFMNGISFGTATRDPQANVDESGFVTDQIVIGTPGTVASWLRCLGQFRLDASCLKIFVLDEADVMIEVEGFFNISMRIRQKLPPTCQILLFSATFEEHVIDFAREFISDAVEIRMRRTQLPLRNIRQFYVQFDDWTQKYDALTGIYGGFDVGQAIIFCATRKEAFWLQGRMEMDGHRVILLSGELEVEQREAAIQQFRQAERRVLITTNLCARGIDIPQVNLIINWNMPLSVNGAVDCDTYLHRIGRSGRFGKDGLAVNFINADELPIIHELERHFETNIPLLTSDDMVDL